MGEYLRNADYIFDDLRDQELVDEQVSMILESATTPEEDVEA
ncbi:hypothetical protein [Photobacterium carnosum]|nr:hypothetical protein [Photobacterium carnosum]